MSRKLLPIFAILALALIGGAVFMIGRRKGWFEKKNGSDAGANPYSQAWQQAQQQAAGQPPVGPPNQAATGNGIDEFKWLQRGSKGAEVRELQKYLGGLTVDGNFGTKTENELFRQYKVNRTRLADIGWGINFWRDANETKNVPQTGIAGYMQTGNYPTPWSGA